jgi:quercetin 2,3-dioxygenase
MTTSMATVLPRREPPPAASAPTRTSLPVLGGYTPDGKPAAAVFLWASTRFRADFEYALHRHEGFEILTLILQGTMGHYDTSTGQWAYLNAGNAQMMRSGSGVSHIERAVSGTRGFQIQFDPGFEAALGHAPSYTDYPAASLTAHQAGDALVSDLIGDGGPIEARTEGLSVRRVALPFGSRAELAVGPGRFTLAYLIDGTATVNGASAAGDDVISLGGADSVTADATAPTDLLVVSLTASPSYEPRRRDPGELGERGAPGGPGGGYPGGSLGYPGGPTGYPDGRGGFPGGPR